jgi:hypothetical protein
LKIAGPSLAPEIGFLKIRSKPPYLPDGYPSENRQFQETLETYRNQRYPGMEIRVSGHPLTQNTIKGISNPEAIKPKKLPTFAACSKHHERPYNPAAEIRQCFKIPLKG